MSEKFEDIFDDVTKIGTKIQTINYLIKGKYPIVDQGQSDVAGYTDNEEGLFTDVPVIIFGDHTRAIKFVDYPFFLGADGVKVLKCKIPNISVKFLYYALLNVYIPNTGYNRHFKWLKAAKINLFDINERNKIVTILDKVTNLIEKRKKQIEKLDELVRSRFIEMFGAIGKKIEDRDYEPISCVCEINPKKSENKTLQNDTLISFVPMPAVTETGDIDVSETKLYKDVKNGFTYFCDNDVLFAKITPCMENGKGAIAKNLRNGIGFGSTEFHVLRPIKGVSNSEWIYFITVFVEFRLAAEKMMTGSAGQRRVPVVFFDKFKVAVPPIELQNKFAEFVEKVEKTKSAIKKSLYSLETLKKSLMQKYFG